MNDKTTRRNQAVSALIQTPVTKPMDLGGLIDTLKQQHNLHRQMAESDKELGRIMNARIHFEAAAVIADILCLYYQTHADPIIRGAAAEWAQRATRLHARATQVRNTLGQNIGATDRA